MIPTSRLTVLVPVSLAALSLLACGPRPPAPITGLVDATENRRRRQESPAA